MLTKHTNFLKYFPYLLLNLQHDIVRAFVYSCVFSCIFYILWQKRIKQQENIIRTFSLIIIQYVWTFVTTKILELVWIRVYIHVIYYSIGVILFLFRLPFQHSTLHSSLFLMRHISMKWRIYHRKDVVFEDGVIVVILSGFYWIFDRIIIKKISQYWLKNFLVLKYGKVYLQ